MSLDPSSHCFRSDTEARVSHYALTLAVDFTSKTLRGHCDYHCVSRDGKTVTELVLDTRDLTIHSVVTSDWHF